MTEIIRLENAVKMAAGDRRALSGVSMRIQEKERVEIYGAPGSGKTTLLKIITGMEKPNDGNVFVLGRPVHEMDADTAAKFRNRNFGILPRDPAFLPGLSVLENVALPLAIRGVGAAQRKKAAMAALKLLEIAYAAQARPARLSGYELQLASLARACAAQPKILLLNEMTAGLSEKETAGILDILNKIIDSGNYTLISFTGTKNSGLSVERKFTLDHGKLQEDIL
jgi:putative ABC transport system ATP-binding protein